MFEYAPGCPGAIRKAELGSIKIGKNLEWGYICHTNVETNPEKGTMYL